MWTKETALVWSNYVPPCRPSRFELDLCSSIITLTRGHTKSPPSVLILGSTNEFREWAFEENCKVTLIDYSSDYYQEITKALKYSVRETVLHCTWQEINFDQEFDLIVGDLVVGNLKPHEVDDFLQRIKRALKQNGSFVTKSFFYNKQRFVDDPEFFLKEYEMLYSYLDPFPVNAYNLTISAMDKSTNMLRFENMLSIIQANYKKGIVSAKTHDRYMQFGWDGIVKGDFYVMPKAQWEKLCKYYFKNCRVTLGPYLWSKDFPIYILTNKTY